LSAGFVSLRGVNKFFDDVHAVANLDLDVHAGEFFSMLVHLVLARQLFLDSLQVLKPPAPEAFQLSHKM